MRLRISRTGFLTFAAAAALWSVAYLFRVRDLGKWADDYWWGNRDPETGAVLQWARLCEVPRISRPLHNLLTSFLQTALWRHDWMNHVVSALSHGLATAMLYVLLRRLGAAAGASAAGALAFLVMPWHFEVPLWNSAIATSLGTATFLVMCLVQIEYSRGRMRGAAAWPLLLVLGVMIPCWNEQPAAGIFALPLLGLAVSPGIPSCRRLWRAFGPAAIGGVVFIAYMWALQAWLPAGTRGGAGTITPSERWWPRAQNLAVVIGRRFTLWEFGRGALATGWECVREAAWWRQAWVGIAAVLAVVWSGANARGRESTDEGAGERGSRLWILLFAATGFVGSWMPCLLVVRAGADWRLTYFASVFLVIGIVGVWPRTRNGALRAVVSLLLACGMVVSVVMLVGVQVAHARVAELDRGIAGQLPELLPNPVPRTCFIPVRVDALAIETGSRLFDLQFRDAMEYRGSSPVLVQMAYRRRDVHAAGYRRYTPGATSVITGLSERGLRVVERVGGTEPDGERGWLLPMERAVPIVIEGDGTVRLVTRLVLVRAGMEVARVEVPQTRGQPELEVQVGVP